LSKETASDYKWVILATAVIVALTCVPYLFGVSVAPPGYRFLGLTHNIDDGAVYLSWIRQAADGHVLIRNQFTNEPQPGGSFNVLFLAMGGFACLTHLSCIDAYHVFRILLGIGLLFAIFKFSGLFISDRRARLLLVPLVGLSSGIGWLIPGAGFPIGPVDVWQPEAITFLSIYLNPLFIAGLLLMLGSLHYLVLMERTGRARHAVTAGLFLLVLGNVHTYDVLTVACVWTAYVATRAILQRTINWRGAALSMLACIVALPSLAYQFHIYQADAIFRARANTVIASPPITSYFAGYGLILLTAIAGAVMLFVEQRRAQDRNDGLRYPFLLPVVWSVVGFAIPYIPMAQQRKLIMGLHIPLCILAAVVIARLGAKLKPVIATGLGCILLLVLFQTNSEFLSLDMALLCDGRTVVATTLPYMSADQLRAMDYISSNSGPNQSTLADAQLSAFLPAYADRPVYCGHWSETPEYGRKLAVFGALIKPSVPPALKRALLLETNCDFVILEFREELDGLGDPSQLGLTRCAKYGEVSIFWISR